MMDKYILNFPEQLESGLQIAEQFQFTTSQKITNVVISGMGGSGIGGTFAYEYAFAQSPVPILVNKSYHLPEFINDNTLVILSSYSGNTEETLSCLNDAVRKNAIIIGITSGGKLEVLSHQHPFPIIKLPQGFPPRTCLGYSLVAVLSILEKARIISDKWKSEIKEAIEILKQHQNDIRALSQKMAQQIHSTFPIIYSLHSEALAVRLRQQLNENSKVLCCHHIIPEMNHNEIVGWKNLSCQHSVISILTDFDLDANRKRYAFCKKVFEQFNVPIIELKAKGHSLLAQWVYIVHIADWISYELALLNNADPIEVKVIDQLKSELSNTIKN